MKKLLAATLVVAALAAAAWWWGMINTAQRAALPDPIESAEPLAPSAPVYPIPVSPGGPDAVPPQEERFEPDQPGADVDITVVEDTSETQPVVAPPLPPLDASDASATTELAQMAGGLGASLADLLVTNELIRKIVVTVDNLDRTPIAPRFRAMVPAEGGFAVDSVRKGRFTIAPENAERYAPFVAAFLAVDPSTMAQLYIRYYPLFQQAYVDLGYPDQYFNDRAVEVIDHLLATPRLNQSPLLVRPKVFYEYAEGTIEQQSWGRKALIRLDQSSGTRQLGAILTHLRGIRAAITTQQAE